MSGSWYGEARFCMLGKDGEQELAGMVSQRVGGRYVALVTFDRGASFAEIGHFRTFAEAASAVEDYYKPERVA